MGTAPWLWWLGFNAFVVALLALDLGVFNRKDHVVTVKEALAWSAFWIGLALAFNAGLYVYLGAQPALQFFTGYLIEKSLSVDNLFVFLLVFAYFRVPAASQQRVLLWGVLGALVMRGCLILVGAALIQRFHWVLYGFGAFLVVTGARMAFQPADGLHPEQNPVVRLTRRFIPVTSTYHGSRFLVREGARWVATPLFLALLVVEASDLVFAVDSIPAIFAVSADPFIVYTSNVFAVLGLRSLYFALSGVLDRFRFFKYGLAAVLAFVGLKMLIADVYKIPVGVALGVVAGLLAVSALASRLVPERAPTPGPAGTAGTGHRPGAGRGDALPDPRHPPRGDRRDTPPGSCP
jgi:tellurite resistance protein TerC